VVRLIPLDALIRKVGLPDSLAGLVVTYSSFTLSLRESTVEGRTAGNVKA
jgi:hypothetical protein